MAFKILQPNRANTERLGILCGVESDRGVTLHFMYMGMIALVLLIAFLL